MERTVTNVVFDDARPIDFRLMREDKPTILLASFDSLEAARKTMAIVEQVVSTVIPRPKVNLELYQGDLMLDSFDQTDEAEEARGHGN
jgi:hypothetical protein